jgi:maltokinase
MTEVLAIPAGASAALVSGLAAGGVTDFDVVGYAPMPDGPLDERPIQVDQTNLSVVVGERVVVKWMRTPAPDARAPKLIGHLASVGFERMPAPYAAVHHDGRLVAWVTAYLPDALDGWDWCVDAVIEACRGGEPADFATALGTLAADLHAALATASPTIPDPVVGGTNPGWGAAGLAVLAEARTAVAGTEDEQFFATVEPYLAAAIEQADAADVARLIHTHGDLHVGQVLRWRGGLAVIDFDGNPTVSAPELESATRDIAQLRNSVLHVGEIANRRTEGRFQEQIREWGRYAVDDLLRAYRATLRVHGKLEVFNHLLLRPFEVEQECRELVYAARFLPRWRYAPMGVLRDWHRGIA